MVITQSRFENFLAVELFFQMKSHGDPVFKGREKGSSSLSCLKEPVLSSSYLSNTVELEPQSSELTLLGAGELLTCYYLANL